MPALPMIRRFRYIGIFTIFTVYFLILVGGVVRATGSGMGCPDWPTCFGQWIPPTSESQLPEDYQQIYADRGYLETEFNVRKTWIEYLNRLLGASTGLLIFIAVLFSIPFIKRDKPVFNYTLMAFFLVGFEGWLGARVVASNLMPGMITVHMIVAQIIVVMLIYAIARSQKEVISNYDVSGLPPAYSSVLKLAMGLTLVQMVMGTQVREAIDLLAHQFDYGLRGLWIDNLPAIFLIHKAFSVIVLAVNIWLVWKLISSPVKGICRFLTLSLAGLIVSTIILGVAMDQFNVPAFAQPTHMWFASLIFGVQYLMYIVIQYSSNKVLIANEQ